MTNKLILKLVAGTVVAVGSGWFAYVSSRPQETIALPPSCTPQAVVVALENTPMPHLEQQGSDVGSVYLGVEKARKAVIR
jgi:hypothetical protein